MDELARLDEATRWGTRTIAATGALDARPDPPARFPVPVVFLMGRYDLHTTYTAARAHFGLIEAPSKAFVTLERSSHVVMLEEPGRFLLSLVNYVLPLAGGAAAFEPEPDPVRRSSTMAPSGG